MSNYEINQFDGSGIVCYYGGLSDEKKLLKSVSGGAATALAESIIKEGGAVFGVTYTSDYKNAVYTIVDTIENINIIKGSKYISAKKYMDYKGSSRLVYEVVMERLNEGTSVLFVGLGCEVGALKSYLSVRKVDTTNLYTADLICHGPAQDIVHKNYIETIEKKYNSSVCDFSIRYKKENKTEQYIHAEFINGKVYEEPFYGSDYAYGFGICSKLSCHECKFKGLNHCADITLGDYWGIRKDMDGYNPQGVSVLLVQTEKGEKLVQGIDKNNFKLYTADIEHILKFNPMYYKSRQIDEKRETFISDIQKKNLHYATVRAQGILRYYRKKLDLLGRIKRVVKFLIYRGGKKGGV